MIISKLRNLRNRIKEKGFLGALSFYLNRVLFGEQIEFNTYKLLIFLLIDSVNKKRMNKNKRKLLFLLFLGFLFLFTLIAVRAYPLFRFFILIPLCLSSGLLYTVFLKDVVPVKNIFTFLSLSLFFGLFFNSFIIFIMGMFGVVISGVFLTYYIVIMVVINVLCFLIFMDEETFSKYFNDFKPEFIDVIWFLIYTFFLFVFIKMCMEMFFPYWDNFTYWSIDAAYIFEQGLLNGKSALDIISKFYLPFFPLQLSYVYFLYGEIVEQFSSLISVIYGFIGVFLLGSYILDLKNNRILKNILYFFVLCGVLALFSSLNVLVTQYADAFCSVLILFYGIVLFSTKPKKSNYFKRFLLILIFSLGIYLTKLAYAPITLFLLLLYVYYDFAFIKKGLKNFFNKRRKPYLIGFVLLAILAVLVLFQRNTEFLSQINQYMDIIRITNLFTKEGFLYSVNVYYYLIQRIFKILILLAFLLGVYIFMGKDSRKIDNKKILLVLMIFLFPIGFYILIQKDLANASLLRYLSLTFYLLPFLFINILENLNFKTKNVLVGLFLCLWVIFLFLQISSEYNLKFEFSPHSGSYKESELLKEHYIFADKILSLVSQESTIMIVREEYEKYLGNIDEPALYLGYYLANHSVGGQYRVDKEKWLAYMLEFKPNYLLILSYSAYWEECNDILPMGNDYLIEMNYPIEENGCFIGEGEIIPL